MEELRIIAAGIFPREKRSASKVVVTSAVEAAFKTFTQASLLLSSTLSNQNQTKAYYFYIKSAS